MKNILLAVQALARAGNSSESDPIFSVSKDHYQNSLGIGLSDLLVKLNRRGLQGYLFGWVLSWKTPTAVAEQVLSSSLGYLYQIQLIKQIVFEFVDSKEAILALVDDSDKDLVADFLDQLQSDNEVAKAALWYPLFYCWGRMTKKDNYTVEVMMQRHLKSLTLGVIGPKIVDQLADSGLLGVVDFGRYFTASFDTQVGHLFEREVVGILGKPDGKSISAVPLQQQIRDWEAKRRRFEVGQQIAIALILEYRSAAYEKHGHYYMAPDFVTKNPKWLIDFITKAVALPGYEDVMEFAKEPSKYLRFGHSMHSFDGVALTDLMIYLSKMVDSEPEKHALIGVDVVETMASLIKYMYNLED